MMYFESFFIGQTWLVGPVTITRDKLASFAHEYDPLPLHLDEDYAKNTSFGGLIAPGVMSFMAVWAEFARLNVWGDGLIAGKSTKIEWLAPVYVGDRLTGGITVSRLTPKNPAGGVVEVTIKITNQDNVLAIRSITETLVKKQPLPDPSCNGR